MNKTCDNRISLSVQSWRLSDYSLDEFVTQELSTLTECNALAIEEFIECQGFETFSKRFINTSVWKGRRLDDQGYAFLYNFVRRVESALKEYRDARSNLLHYIESRETKRDTGLYLEALRHFELYLFQATEAFNLWEEYTKFIDKDEQSEERSDFIKGLKKECNFKKINRLYQASKHSNEQIKSINLPTRGLVIVWITNTGLNWQKNKEQDVLKVSWEDIAQNVQGLGQMANILIKGRS